ncbi:MAG: hypothetical protein ACLUNZ_02335 [Evtepia sp.]
MEENRAESAPQLTLLQPPAQPQAPETVLRSRRPRRRKWLPRKRLAAGRRNQTYLIGAGDTVHLIDKHAAHERMNFDRAEGRGLPTHGTDLAGPRGSAFPPPEEVALLDNLDSLASICLRRASMAGLWWCGDSPTIFGTSAKWKPPCASWRESC